MSFVVSRGNKADVLREGKTFVVVCRGTCKGRREFTDARRAEHAALIHNTRRGHGTACSQL